VNLDYYVVQISQVRMNPYVRLLQEALSEAGVSCSMKDGLEARSVCAQKGAVGVLHLHWLELLYSSSTLLRTVRRLAQLLAGLVWVKAHGCKLVYTVHNLDAHERPFPLLNRLANRLLFALADALHVHDEEARRNLARLYGPKKRSYVVPHGSYVGAYPNQCSRQEARARLGLADKAFVYLFLGQIRRYKGVEDLIAAFDQLTDASGELVLAGNVHDPAYVQVLEGLVRGRDRIHVSFQYVPDSELQYFLNACDVCVMPYRDVTTSGAAILAFSFGRPIIAPAVGGFKELAAGDRGILYDPQARDGLLQALQQARRADMQVASQRAWKWALEHQWSMVAPAFVRIYEDVVGRRK